MTPVGARRCRETKEIKSRYYFSLALAMTAGTELYGCSSNPAASSTNGMHGSGGTTVTPEPVGPGETPSTNDGRPVLPIEGIGKAGDVWSVKLKLDSADSVTGLFLHGHRLAYRDASVNSSRGPKVSVRLNDGKWLGLTNDTVECFAHELAYGCLNGTYASVRLTVDVAKLGKPLQGENALSFRFEGTDGFTSGFRILDLDFMSGTKRLLGKDYFAESNPNSWTPPLSSADDIAQGQQLFEKAQLYLSPLAPDVAIHASCADCHARDGRDLKYFNYSSWSIQARSEFHGLSPTEGKQIASFIRSISLKLPSGVDINSLGRPYSPPFQPAPGLDSRPVELWSAGGGLEAILEHDSQMSEDMFPLGLFDASTDAIAAPDGTINHREIRNAIQFPDWNEWLPEIHPKDIFGEEFAQDPVMIAYETLATQLESERDGLVASGEAANKLSNFITIAELLRRDIDTGDRIVSDPDAGRSNSMKWLAVKQWELVERHRLDEMNRSIYGEDAEPRSWPTLRRNVFEIAPHRTAENKTNFAHQALFVGKYFSTAWYELQVVINEGNRHGGKLSPVDWNYQPNHISNLFDLEGPAHPYRYAATYLELYQQNLGRSPSDSNFGLVQMHPARFAVSSIFDELTPAERVRLVTLMLNSFLAIFEAIPPEAFPRRTTEPRADDGLIEDVDYVPTARVDASLDSIRHQNYWADAYFMSIPVFRSIGVEAPTLTRMIDWGAAMWPLGDWNSLR